MEEADLEAAGLMVKHTKLTSRHGDLTAAIAKAEAEVKELISQARQLEYRLGETPGQSEKASAELADVEAERAAEEQDAGLDKVRGWGHALWAARHLRQTSPSQAKPGQARSSQVESDRQDRAKPPAPRCLFTYSTTHPSTRPPTRPPTHPPTAAAAAATATTPARRAQVRQTSGRLFRRCDGAFDGGHQLIPYWCNRERVLRRVPAGHEPCRQRHHHVRCAPLPHCTNEGVPIRRMGQREKSVHRAIWGLHDLSGWCWNKYPTNPERRTEALRD